MPGSIRLYCDAALHEGAVVAASPRQAHYLGRVMRRTPGDEIRVFNGRDGEWQASILRIGTTAEFRATLRLRPQDAEPDLWLLAAPLRRDLTELVVQKATELGVSRILPVITARTNPARGNPARLAAIAIEAAEQSERLSVPDIDAPRPLDAVLEHWPAGRVLVAAVERRDLRGVPPQAGPAALLVGPEGGFTAAELDGPLRAAFVVAASLGPRILRAETAAIVGLALLQARPPPAPLDTEP